MWFLMKLYYQISPQKIVSDENGFINAKNLTFDEYIENKIDNFGFLPLIDNICNDYIYNKWCDNSSHEFINSHEEMLSSINKKWRYFTKNNLRLKDECIKVGDKLKYKGIGDVTYEDAVVTSIDIPLGCIRGTIYYNDRTYEGCKMSRHRLYDKNMNKISKFVYEIKRRGRVYDVANKG